MGLFAVKQCAVRDLTMTSVATLRYCAASGKSGPAIRGRAFGRPRGSAAQAACLTRIAR
jgi:hypothetical protein